VKTSVLALGLLSIATTGIATARLVMYQTGIPESYRQELIRNIGSGR
jgi:hypothetical protein